MIIRVDIDETICYIPKEFGRDYSKAVPIKDRINMINLLYRIGHTIIYWTSRGATTHKDWRNTTLTQFKEWGVLFHSLELNKPNYDVFIDDKSLRIQEIPNGLIQR